MSPAQWVGIVGIAIGVGLGALTLYLLAHPIARNATDTCGIGSIPGKNGSGTTIKGKYRIGWIMLTPIPWMGSYTSWRTVYDDMSLSPSGEGLFLTVYNPFLCKAYSLATTFL